MIMTTTTTTTTSSGNGGSGHGNNNTSASDATLHLFGLRRGTLLQSLGGTTMTITTPSSFDDDDTRPPLDRHLVEAYGTRCAVTRTALTEGVRRLVRDAEGFRRLQARLRSSSSSSTTDAWLKQNLVGVVRTHAREAELRQADRRRRREEEEAAEAAAAAEEEKEAAASPSLDPDTTDKAASPTSVLSFWQGDPEAVVMKERVAAPPLSSSAAASSSS